MADGTQTHAQGGFRLITPDGMELNLPAELPDGHMVVNAVVGFETVNVSSDDDGIGWAANRECRLASQLGLAKYLNDNVGVVHLDE